MSFLKTFSRFFFLRMLISVVTLYSFFFSFLPAHPSVSVQPLFDLTHVYIYIRHIFGRTAVCSLENSTFFSPSFGFTLLALD